MDVMDAARNVAEDYEGGAHALALRIDKNPTTLSHELAETGTAKLGLRTAVKMSKRAGDPRILNAFAAEMGCWVLPMPAALAVEGDQVMQDLGRMAGEFADVVREVSASCADGVITANELHRIEREGGEFMRALQTMLVHVRAQYEAGLPEAARK